MKLTPNTNPIASIIMTLLEAIDARHAVRKFQDRPLDEGAVAMLRNEIDRCNREGGLHIQLVTHEPVAFGTGMASYGIFSGVSNYMAMICRKGDEVSLGYYGEQLVLLAQTLGINSCWVGLTFKKQPDHYTIADGEKLACVVALGYGETQGTPHPQKKGIEAYYDDRRMAEASQPLPDWFRNGMEAALKAPTAVNQQKFRFTLLDGAAVRLETRFTLLNAYAQVDLGIVRCHFEIAAGKDHFYWAD